MKTKLIVLLVLTVLGFVTQGLCQEMKIKTRPQGISKSNHINFPPGTIKVKQYFVDETEIGNIHWNEYLFYRKKEVDSATYQLMLPDSLNTWYTLREHYFAPIVLITYEQAMDYCKWRSEVVSRKFNKKITYRLPTPEEWKEIAQEVIRTDSAGVEKSLAETAKNVRKAPNYLIYNGMHKLPKDGIKNLFDNVSEMTSVKYIALGSNNKQLTSLENNLNQTITYSTPSAYLGFRCIAEVEE